MSLSAALEEAYASGDENGFALTTAQIDHAAFTAPLYIVRAVDDLNGAEGATISLPIVSGGSPVVHTACAFGFVRPGADKDGPTEGKIQIDNVSGQIYAALKQAIGYGSAVTITFRQYLVEGGNLAAITGPDEEIAGLQLQDVSFPSALTCEGTVAWPDGRKFNVPTGDDAFFDRVSYPALFS